MRSGGLTFGVRSPILHRVASYFPHSPVRRTTNRNPAVAFAPSDSLTSRNSEYTSFIGLATQVHLRAVRAFKGDVHFLAVESEGPLLRFAVP
jgi:hypothetical protein